MIEQSLNMMSIPSMHGSVFWSRRAPAEGSTEHTPAEASTENMSTSTSGMSASTSAISTASGSTATRKSKKVEQKIARSKAKKEARKSAPKKHTGSKAEKCGACGQKGHLKSNKICPKHPSKQRDNTTTAIETEGEAVVKRSKFTIKTKLGDTKVMGLRDTIINATKHVRDVTCLGSMFVSFHCYDYIERINASPGANIEIPILNHSFIYDCFSLAMDLGGSATSATKECFERFKATLGADFDAQRFKSKGYSKLITEVAKDYATAISNHVGSNYKLRTERYFWTRMCSRQDYYYLSCSIATAKTLAEKIYESICDNSELVIPLSLNLTPQQKGTVKRLKEKSSFG